MNESKQSEIMTPKDGDASHDGKLIAVIEKLRESLDERKGKDAWDKFSAATSP